MFLAPCKYPFALLTLSLLLTSIGLTPNCLLAADPPVTRVDAETDKCRNLKTHLIIKATIEARKDKNYAKGMDEVREGSTLRLVEPGDYGTIIISKNNVIVEGDPESQTPGEIKAAFSISGKNCLIRGVHCTELKPTAPVKIIDSYIEQINIENNVEKGFAEIWASNCIISTCLIRGPQGYTKITPIPKDPRNPNDNRQTTTTKKFPSSSSNSDFVNCVFKDETPLNFAGAMQVSFKKCIFSTSKSLLTRLPEKNSSSNLIKYTTTNDIQASFDTCVFYDKSFKEDLKDENTDAILCKNGDIYLKSSLKGDEKILRIAKTNGKMHFLQKDPFEAADPSKNKFSEFVLPQDSPSFALGAGITLDQRGFPGAVPKKEEVKKEANP